MALTDDAAIEVTHVSCRYGRTEALHDVTLTLRAGSIFALLGPNGAGKTTTIRVLMNMLRPAAGEARVLGVDSRRLGPSELRQIGYVSESQKPPAWMTLDQLLAYCRPFYPAWDDKFARKLVDDFQLPRQTPLGRLSRGMGVKAALVSALAFRPRLLILDEPFSGLDPVVRDDLVHGVLGLAGEERWSVFLSSHDLDEVERLVDDVGFMDAGRVVLAQPFEELHKRFRRVEVTLDGQFGPAQGLASGPTPPGWIGFSHAGRIVRFVDSRYAPEDLEREARAMFPGARVDAHPMSLREIFVALVRHRRSTRPETAR